VTLSTGVFKLCVTTVFELRVSGTIRSGETFIASQSAKQHGVHEDLDALMKRCDFSKIRWSRRRGYARARAPKIEERLRGIGETDACVRRFSPIGGSHRSRLREILALIRTAVNMLYEQAEQTLAQTTHARERWLGSRADDETPMPILIVQLLAIQ
jgi:hypothetical protein